MSTTGEPVSKSEERTRFLLGRLPLLLCLTIGLAVLWHLDQRLIAEYRTAAITQAARMEAAVEGAMQQRITLLRSLRQLVAEAKSRTERQARFRAFSREMTSAIGDVRAIYRLDREGRTIDRWPTAVRPDALFADQHLLLAQLADGITRARNSGETSVTSVVPLGADTLGVLLYEPVVDADRLTTGYVAAEIAYGQLLQRALATEREGPFGYRILDRAGTTLAASVDYPERVARLVHRRIALPAGEEWQLDIAIEPFRPLLARVILWVVGLLLLGVVVVLVFRERVRAERFQLHSMNLEILSRSLLDANIGLEDRARQVAEANQAKSRFLANVSHELRTPVNAIIGYNSLALGGLYGDLAGKLRSAHERIGVAGDHLLRLVNDVLDLSKIETNRMEVELGLVDLEAMLREVVAVVEPAADAKHVRLDLVITREIPPVITDGQHVRRILLNLVSNAIKFTSNGFVVVIARRGTGADAGTVRIEVEDSGIGIESEDLERIFEEFEQVRPEGRGNSVLRGSGLGLAVSRKLARLLGGDVRAASRVGAGSRFTLVLPANGLAETPPGARAAFVGDEPNGVDADCSGVASVRAGTA
jgi:signal transduction histidine kinase